MAIKKQYLKGRPVCKVTFSLEGQGALQASVVGDFNHWDPEAGALNRLKNGTFKGMVELPTGNQYEFRYLIDGNFINEPQADRFQWNDHAGGENGVLEV